MSSRSKAPVSTHWYNPPLGQVPGVVSLSMLSTFLRCLPRRLIGASRVLGREMIQDALATVDAWSPRDRFEAPLVMQIATLGLSAREAELAATAEPDFDLRMRITRYMSMLQRRAEGLGAEVRRHRRELKLGLNLQHVAPLAQGYDLDALEAVWHDPERELEERT